MASAKIATLVIRVSISPSSYTPPEREFLRTRETLAKPISNQIKVQAKQHETFRSVCIGLAQRMHRFEVGLRTNLLGEPAKHIRPLSETRAIENGANALAEGFLFGVAAALIIGETWRSSRNQSKRRDSVDEQLEELQSQVGELTAKVDGIANGFEERLEEEKLRNDEITRILTRVVEIGLRGGWAEFEETPLRLPRIQLDVGRRPRPPPPSDPDGTDSGSSSSDNGTDITSGP